MRRSKKVVDSVDWDNIPNKNSMPKKAIKEAVKKAGNSNRLAILLGVSNAQISQWIWKDCPKSKDLMHPTSAKKIEKAVKIKDLHERLCPSMKK